MAPTSTLDTVVDVMAGVLARKGAAAAPLTAATPLDGAIGLDSLDFAEVVARLEQQFGFDPFASGTIDRLRTVGDLAALYAR